MSDITYDAKYFVDALDVAEDTDSLKRSSEILIETFREYQRFLVSPSRERDALISLDLTLKILDVAVFNELEYSHEAVSEAHRTIGALCALDVAQQAWYAPDEKEKGKIAGALEVALRGVADQEGDFQEQMQILVTVRKIIGVIPNEVVSGDVMGLLDGISRNREFDPRLTATASQIMDVVTDRGAGAPLLALTEYMKGKMMRGAPTAG